MGITRCLQPGGDNRCRIRGSYMRIKLFMIFSILLIVSSCYTGTRTVAPEGQPVVTNMAGTQGLNTKVLDTLPLPTVATGSSSVSMPFLY